MTRAEREERRRLLAEGTRQQARADFYEANTPRQPQLNRFQKWASDYARPFGFTVTPCGNWVTLYRDGPGVEAMTARGVQEICHTRLSPGPAGWTLSRGIDNDRADPMGHPYARHCGRLAWTRAGAETGTVEALQISRSGDYGGSFAIVPSHIFKPVEQEPTT